MPDSPVLGLDVGGTRTRALLATSSGERLGTGTAPGGNPVTHGTDAAVDRMADAVRDALGTRCPDIVEACVVGLAGVGKYATDADLAAAELRIRDRLGLTCDVSVVGDITVAFAAGTSRASGSILLAGTGAIAGRVHDRELIAEQDGYGWLLGDEGSGFWIGRQAMRATLAAIDGRAEVAALSGLVIDAYDRSGAVTLHLTARARAIALVTLANESPAIDLASLAPLVMKACALGDAAAEHIIREAAESLVATLALTGPDSDDSVIVLAGGILAPASPVRNHVAKLIAERWPRAVVTSSRDGAAGAAWLAALPLLDGDPALAMHQRLLHGHRLFDR